MMFGLDESALYFFMEKEASSDLRKEFNKAYALYKREQSLIKKHRDSKTWKSYSVEIKRVNKDAVKNFTSGKSSDGKLKGSRGKVWFETKPESLSGPELEKYWKELASAAADMLRAYEKLGKSKADKAVGNMIERYCGSIFNQMEKSIEGAVRHIKGAKPKSESTRKQKLGQRGNLPLTGTAK